MSMIATPIVPALAIDGTYARLMKPARVTLSGTSHKWDLVLFRSWELALETLLVVRPGAGTLTLE